MNRNAPLNCKLMPPPFLLLKFLCPSFSILGTVFHWWWLSLFAHLLPLTTWSSRPKAVSFRSLIIFLSTKPSLRHWKFTLSNHRKTV